MQKGEGRAGIETEIACRRRTDNRQELLGEDHMVSGRLHQRCAFSRCAAMRVCTLSKATNPPSHKNYLHIDIVFISIKCTGNSMTRSSGSSKKSRKRVGEHIRWARNIPPEKSLSHSKKKLGVETYDGRKPSNQGQVRSVNPTHRSSSSSQRRCRENGETGLA
jgi:hypothetical protein